jgi:serine/threonine protein phosphatase 1
MKSFVVGDIHGCARELTILIESLPLDAGDRLVFLGDYIDRGPDSSRVVSFLIDLQRKQQGIEMIFLRGNHESMFLAFLGVGGAHGDMFLFNGGKATLASYGVDSNKPKAQEVLSAIPTDHMTFYRRLQVYYLMDPFLCVHAGIDPEKTLAQQTDEELLWIPGSR